MRSPSNNKNVGGKKKKKTENLMNLFAPPTATGNNTRADSHAADDASFLATSPATTMGSFMPSDFSNAQTPVLANKPTTTAVKVLESSGLDPPFLLETGDEDSPDNHHKDPVSTDKNDNDLLVTEETPLVFKTTITTTEMANDNAQTPSRDDGASATQHLWAAALKDLSSNLMTPSTWIGSFTFLLYQIVFCLAQAATIRRPTASVQSTGELAQLAALGVIVAGPVMIYQTSPQIPAVYPASDLFLAPFLAHMAADVDQTLYEYKLQDNSQVFLATFTALLVSSMALSGLWCLAAARIRLANLGHFLPNPVLTGFFTTIGILMWTLGFSVDSGGLKLRQVLMSGDWNVISTAFLHHLPSFLIGLAMHVTNPIHPSLVIGWLVLTILGAYTLMGFLGVDLQTAQENSWFYKPEELSSRLVANSMDRHDDSSSYGPPYPFGFWMSLAQGNVFWPAYVSGIRNMLALTVLYLIRCSLHAAALKKNIPNVTRTPMEGNHRRPSGKIDENPLLSRPGESQSNVLESQEIVATVENTNKDVNLERIKAANDTKRKLALDFILEKGYAYPHLVAAVTGAISVGPALAASMTLFQLGCERAAPQYGSCLLLIAIYCTNFSIVQYIPKPTFSSLMVLAGLDMSRSWMIRSYYQTKSKVEWMVAPILVTLAFCFGLLNAIFVGVAISTFWFAASFQRSGVVKYVGNGIALRSTVERGFDQVAWLDENADVIQILVLQNYLFFGNVQSVLNFMTTMFEDYMPSDKGKDEEADQFEYIPPIPQHVILDFALVTGMDTSAVDMFKDLISLCRANNCKLYLAGMSSELRSMLAFAKVVPIPPKSDTNTRKQRSVFYGDLEAALAKAEDDLMSSVFHLEEKGREEAEARTKRESSEDEENGFSYALDMILEQHGDQVADAVQHLRSLAGFSTRVVLEEGQALTQDEGGLYFVEFGLMHVRRRTASGDTTQGRSGSTWSGSQQGFAGNMVSLTELNARSLAREAAYRKQKDEQRLAAASTSAVDDQASALLAIVDPYVKDHPTFRLARVGHGWISGSLPLAAENTNSGVLVAVSPCRLHHVSRQALLELERSQPETIMQLYKLLACLSWKRQEKTIGQLNQLLKILKSPTPRLRKGKSDLGKMHAWSFS
mmetsp:Transcript_25689/g.60414  ORF Transcript_25689/g.60414 Transcript_25689/m.60414 type:complete len:1133 (+) Transcript_25689:154-3552(+)